MNPDAPFDWIRSNKDNLTCEWNFLNSTVFKSGAGYKNVINVDGADSSNAAFSQSYMTEDEARHYAEAKMIEMLQTVLSRRR